MKNSSHRTVKSITRNAMFISMILHVFFLIALFYFSVSDQPVLSFHNKIDATIETIPKTVSKKPMQAPIHRQFKTNVHETAKTPLAKVESITPELIFQSRVATTRPTRVEATTPIVAEQPHLKQTDTTPDVKVNVSTALNELRQVEDGLSKTEAAEPIVGSSFGSKRSGGPDVQRRPIPATIDVAGTTVDDDAVPTQIGDIQGNETAVPYVRFSKVMEKLHSVPFSKIMKSLANEILETSDGGPIDVVFVIDTSSSMNNDIKAVAYHLTEMIDVYKFSGIDYALGLTKFYEPVKRYGKRGNIIEVGQLTREFSEYQLDLYSIVPYGQENALDAIEKTVNEMRFRATSKKHLILVTDEPFTSLEGLTVEDSIALCREFGIFVNVIGLSSDKEHQLLASETNGKWHPIPMVYTMQQEWQVYKMQQEWQNLQKIGKIVLQNSTNTPIDIVLFIDGSKSMEEKLPHFLEQLDVWIRDWDNALIDYQIGVVRFRTHGAVNADRDVNFVNVFNPPQTLEQIHKIAELPCQDDENLLHAINEGLRRIKLRPGAKTHLILVTDEPTKKNTSSLGMIQFLKEKQAIVSVIGTLDKFQMVVAQKTGGMWVPIPAGHTTNKEQW